MAFLKYFTIALILFISINPVFSQEKELRGAWVAWAGSSVPSKSLIAETMEALADANFNVVYVDVWRFGYPYFRSELFHSLTGLYTDPSLPEGRDVLADMIAEGHRVGLEVDAWFESGFAATSGANIDLYEARPYWFAQKKSGARDYYSNGGIRYFWLSHCNREAQDFLIELALEVVRNYDVDGIEFDRVRYPELDCGYDSATVELYKSEHEGDNPPTNTANSSWIRWRADKLNLFVARLYDSLKTANPDIEISNAPLPWGYEQFCQDWTSWINNGYLDNVATQMYYTDNDTYTWRLDREMGLVYDDTKMYPGISTTANGQTTSPSELVKMVQTTRNRGLQGNVHWYAFNLIYGNGYLEALKTEVYQQKVLPPYREEDWQRDVFIINETDAGVERSENWTPYTAIPGFDDTCLVTTGGTGEWIEYSATVTEAGWYELYVFNVNQWNAHPQAPYVVYSFNAPDSVFVRQNESGLARWYKLGDYYYESGMQKVLRLTDENIETHNLFADAVMLMNNRRIQDSSSSAIRMDHNLKPSSFSLLKAYPNPFNGRVQIDFKIPESGPVSALLFDSRGRLVQDLGYRKYPAGIHTIKWDAEAASSGVYFLKLGYGESNKITKLVLVR